MTQKISRGFSTGALLILLALLVNLLPSQLRAEAVGKFSLVKGTVDLLEKSAEQAVPAAKGDPVSAGDIVRTMKLSRAHLNFNDGSNVYISEKSRIEVVEFFFDPEKKRRSGMIRSFRGKMRSVVPKAYLGEGSRYEVHTPTAVTAARGTDYMTIVGGLPLRTEVVVFEGLVAVRNIDPDVPGEVLLKAGQATTVDFGRPPTPPREMSIEEQRILLRSSKTEGETVGEDTVLEEALLWEPVSGEPEENGTDEDVERSLGEESQDEDTLQWTAQPVIVPITETEPNLVNPSVTIDIQFP